MRFVVVGAGAAGSACAAGLLRFAGPSDELVLIERTPSPPPSPALWPEYAAGATGESLFWESAPWRRWVDPQGSADPRLIARWGTCVESVDPASRRILLGTGESLAYDRLLMATGGAPRIPLLPGLQGPGVHHIGSLEGAAQLRKRLAARARGLKAAVIGGGPSGLRLAELLFSLGLRVVLLEAGRGLLPGVAPPPASAVLVQAAENLGLRIITGAEVCAVFRGPANALRGLVYRLGEKEAFEKCDLAVFCTGRTRGAGLAVGLDMAVAGAEALFAAGDCALPAGWTAPPGLFSVAAWQGRQAALAFAGLPPGPPMAVVVRTVRFLGLLVTARRPYSALPEQGGEGGPWTVEVKDPAAIEPAAWFPPEVSRVAD